MRDSSSASPSPARPALIALLATVVAGLALLVFWQPLNAGYADFRRTVAQTLAIYWKDPTWQHGALAPLIAGWLIWKQRDTLARLQPQPSWFGLPLLLVAAFLFFAGYKANNFYLGVAAIQTFLAGAVLWTVGWEHGKRMLFPWLILCFSWPLIFLEETLAFHLRMIMVRFTSTTLNLIGIDTLADGTSLVSAPTETAAMGERFQLNIDGPCSGMRSLFALMMVSALFSFFRQQTLPRRLTLFLCSIPLSVIANLVRLLVLVFATLLFGQEFAVGDQEKEVSTFHFLSGIVVFIVALSGLQFCSTLITRFFPKRL